MDESIIVEHKLRSKWEHFISTLQVLDRNTEATHISTLRNILTVQGKLAPETRKLIVLSIV